MMPTPRARRERHVILILLVLVMVVGGTATAVNSGQASKANTAAEKADRTARKADQTARGLVKASCVLVYAIEGAAATQQRSADTLTALIQRTRRSDPERGTRLAARRAALRQKRQYDAMVRDMRKGIRCKSRPKPPRLGRVKDSKKRKKPERLSVGTRTAAAVVRPPSSPPKTTTRRVAPRPRKKKTTVKKPSTVAPVTTATSAPALEQPPVTVPVVEPNPNGKVPPGQEKKELRLPGVTVCVTLLGC